MRHQQHQGRGSRNRGYQSSGRRRESGHSYSQQGSFGPQNNWAGDFENEGRSQSYRNQDEDRYTPTRFEPMDSGERSFQGYNQDYERDSWESNSDWQDRRYNQGRGFSGRGYGSQGYGSQSYSSNISRDKDKEAQGWGRDSESSFYRPESSSFQGYEDMDETATGQSNQPYPTRSSGQRSGSTEGRWGRGQHTGVGPKSYMRSDDRIKEDVCEALSQHGDIDASDIEVEVENGEVTLKGTVDERRIKRLAEQCIEDLSGVKEVHNQLRTGAKQGQQFKQNTDQTKQGRSESLKGKAA